MQLRALKYFDELVRTGSMRAAAENLGVAATAVSRQIENLEHFFGATLVERSSRGVKLTAAGELLAVRAGRTLREIDHLRRLIDDLKGLQRGRVRICASGAVVADLLAPALAEFGLRYPKIRFEIVVTSAQAAIDAVVAAEADMAITLFAGSLTGTRRRLKVRLDYEAVLAPDHPLAPLAAVPVAELARHALAVPETGFGARAAIDALFADADVSFDPVFVTSSLEMLKEMVMRGAAVTLLPATTVERERRAGLVVVRPIADGKGIRTDVELCVAADRQPSFAAAKLLDFVDRFMRERSSAPPSR